MAGPRDATRGGGEWTGFAGPEGAEGPLWINPWGAGYRVLKDKKIGEGTIELIPGS